VRDVEEFGHPRLPGDVDRQRVEIREQRGAVLAFDQVEELGAAASADPGVRLATGSDGEELLQSVTVATA
jgi:hypothetical protein